MKPRGIARSDVGMVRDHNEDAFFTDDALGLYIVADGVGGHAAGEVASRIAVDCTVAVVRAGLAAVPEPTSADLQALVHVAAREAAVAVHQRSEEERELHGMATTLTVLLVHDGDAVVAHVGDSRLYLLRDGRLSQVTFDHTAMAELVRLGVLDADDARNGQFGHVLSRSLGSDPDVEPDVLPLTLQHDDRLLLCSDGLSDHVHSESDLLVDFDAPLQEIPDSLVNFANAAGGHDNVTVVVVEMGVDTSRTASFRPLSDLSGTYPIPTELD